MPAFLMHGSTMYCMITTYHMLNDHCVIQWVTRTNCFGRSQSKYVPSKQSVLSSSRATQTPTPLSAAGKSPRGAQACKRQAGLSPRNRPLASLPQEWLLVREPRTPGTTQQRSGCGPPPRLGCERGQGSAPKGPCRGASPSAARHSGHPALLRQRRPPCPAGLGPASRASPCGEWSKLLTGVRQGQSECNTSRSASQWRGREAGCWPEAGCWRLR